MECRRKFESAGFWGFFPKACRLIDEYSLQGGTAMMALLAAVAGLFTWLAATTLILLIELVMALVGWGVAASKVEEASDFVAVAAVAFVAFLLGFHEGVIGYRMHLAEPLREAQGALESMPEDVVDMSAQRKALERDFEKVLRPRLEQFVEESLEAPQR